MDEKINTRLKLSRIYKFKKLLIQELNDLRKELSSGVKKIYVSENIPESQEFSHFFRDYEYIRLNKFISEQINQLEKPISGETEESLQTEIENLKAIINEIVSQLSETIKKINHYITIISGDTNTISVEKFLSDMRIKISPKIERDINREVKPDIEKLKEKVDYIYRYENYSEIMGFLANFEREVNLYLSQKGMEKIQKIFESHKKEVITGVKQYLERYLKSKKTQEKIIEDILQTIEKVNINTYSIHYSLPDVRKHFSRYGSNISKIDIIMSNMESPRFITLFLTGLFVFFGGMFVPAFNTFKGIIILTGLLVAVYAFIDSAYFNRFYIRKYIKQIRENLKEEIHKSLDHLLESIKNSIIKTLIKIENLILPIIKKETRSVKDFENYLVVLRNNIEKYIINISHIKKEFEYEISEED